MLYLSMITAADASHEGEDPEPSNILLLIMDQHRTNFDPRDWSNWEVAIPGEKAGRSYVSPVPISPNAEIRTTNFGPLWFSIIKQ